MVGLILNERYLIITFRFKEMQKKTNDKIALSCNKKSLNEVNPEMGWVRIDLSKLFHIHRIYEIKRKRLQKKALKKPSFRKVLAKYSKREKNRTKDFIHKLS